ncbi:MAG: carbohydrate ABC transporter permease [Lachnospiraceae bacterium]|nr:carbohydrate ABC transporter permease [Lachnospiraceae bacterium]
MIKNKEGKTTKIAVKRGFSLKGIKGGKIISGLFFASLIIGICFAILYPILTLLPMVFTDLRELGAPDSIWIPGKFGMNSIEFVFRSVLRGDPGILLKSIGYALSICAIQVFMSAMAGYALARTNFWGKNLIFFLVIFVFLVPRQSFLITQYLHFKHFDILGLFKLFTGGDVDLINQPATLYLLAIFGFSVNQSLFVFIFRQFFLGLPQEIEEASLIDGAGFYKTYFRIMLPNALPTILTVAVLSFVWAYGDTYYTNYFHTDGPYFGVIIDKTFKDANNWYINNQARQWFDTADTNELAFEALKQASIVTFLTPLLLIYFMVQRKIVENLDRAGIVG